MTAAKTAFERIETPANDGRTLNVYTGRQIRNIVIVSALAGGMAAAYVSGKISYGFGVLAGTDCTASAVADYLDSPRDDIAMQIYYDNAGQCVRNSGFPGAQTFKVR